jgi:TPR repeat protein
MLKSRLLISLAVLSCLLFNASLSHDCLAGFYDKHSANDVKHLMVKANAGDRIAQEELAGVYQSGEGIAKSEDQAVIWYKKAALQGCASSQRFLGYHYLLIAKDYKNAFYWFEKSAKAGDKVAQFCLGRMYLNGVGVGKSTEKAFYWLGKGGQQHYYYSSILMAGTYIHGNYGIKKNIPEAFKWYDKGAEDGDYAHQDFVAKQYFKQGGWYTIKGLYWQTASWINLIKCLVEDLSTGFKSTVARAESHLDPTCANQPQ